MSLDLVFNRVLSVPDRKINGPELLRAIGRNTLAISYDLGHGSMSIGVDREATYKLDRIVGYAPGLSFERCAGPRCDGAVALACYSGFDRELEYDPFKDISDSIGSGTFTVIFAPARSEELDNAKEFLERRLSSMDIRETKSSPRQAYSGTSLSLHKDLFTASYERSLFRGILESINLALMNGGLAYKIFFLASENDSAIYRYIEDRFLILNRFKGNCKGINETASWLCRQKTFAFDPGYAGAFVSFHGNHRVLISIPSKRKWSGSGIVVGTFMKDGVADTCENVAIDKTSINLGFLLSGLPGSGKTSEAMAIISGIMRLDASAREEVRTRHVIITPTSEWRGFASGQKMKLIRLYEDCRPINFFRCPPGIDRHKFYENLAMVLASASNAGPYQNPMEKCMLNAFRRVYESTSEPEPMSAYNEIEESIINLHGKRTHTGVKYTKHGENIKSALENLRSIISRPEYSAKDGMNIEDLISNGVVFDISNASNATKPYLYALVLNMVYAISSTFDVHGDESLRLLICLEESQMVFWDRRSAAVKDLKQRMQDFRKQGIGLMLITHNVDDVELGIRRLCQLKLYLKQASDVCEVAARDLVIAGVSEDDIAGKLKALDSRTGAFSYVGKAAGSKTFCESIFIKTADYPAK
ncbi:MAG: hypothetical protein KGH60_02930 [Candidatus Micrarchaeota archaeon]|nr:hypothetical protein [Candidatus Micrarchaeota archaeon]